MEYFGPGPHGEDAGSPENAGGVLMRWPWRREVRLIEPRAGSQHQGPGAGDGQGDTGRGLRCQARRGGGDDTEAAGGERVRGARGRRWPAMFCLDR